MPRANSHLPSGLRTVTPALSVKNASEAITFYGKAFGAQLRSHAAGPTPGSTIHAEIGIGDSVLMLADEMPGSPVRAPTTAGGSTVSINLFVPDCDALFQRAVAAGARPLMPPADMFWGDRYSQVIDPFGHVWAIATHQEDVSSDEMEQRTKAFFEEMARTAGASSGQPPVK
jgi:PhnB protein